MGRIARVLLAGGLAVAVSACAGTHDVDRPASSREWRYDNLLEACRAMRDARPTDHRYVDPISCADAMVEAGWLD